MIILQKVLEIFRLRPDYDKRVFGLDLMRALAIISVVMGHELVLEKADTNFPWIRLLHGVELFFVLSGFLIGGILIKTFNSSDSFGIKTIGEFWVRRWFRTLPNYYLVLVLNIIVVYFGIIKEDFTKFNWKFFLFLQNFTTPNTGFFWESWSISIEEWFYVFFPVILAAIYFLLKRFRVDKKLIFFSSIFIFLLIPFLLRFFHASQFEVDTFWLWFKILKVVIYRLDGIALGVLAAFLKYYYPEFWYKCRNISFIAGFTISYVVLYWTWLPSEFSSKVYRILFEDIGCLLLLPKFDSIRKAPVIVKKVFTHISLISYSMYLLNLALVSEIIRDNFPPQGPYSAWALYIVYWVAVIVFSTLLYKYFEKPMMDLRDKPFMDLRDKLKSKIAVLGITYKQ
ncbi:MAG: acyltransferase [Sporocytophaga sp.]|jgi:peptidoglycan/LPS O-acetylase OafA/YrhL|nr:acyltransferase [Sporocytophaga sp.]